MNAHDRSSLQLEYEKNLLLYHGVARSVHSILTNLIAENIVVSIASRVKTFDSFYLKASKLTDKGLLKYDNPFSQIEDVIGFRIIVFARRSVEQVCEAVRQTFSVASESNKSEELLLKGQLGYESHHLIADLGDRRNHLGEYSGLCAQRFEIQVRTALQHAWAENEHKIQYKSNKKDPDLVKRFLRLAGIISAADEEFDRIYEINEKLVDEVIDAVDELDEEIDADRDASDLGSIAYQFGQPVSELVKSRRYKEAEQLYSALIAVQPQQLTHYSGRAKARALMGDIDGALEDLTQASDLNPNHPAIHSVLRRLDPLITLFDDDA